MSFRIEEKIPLSKSDGIDALSVLFKKGFRELHPERLIQSAYFDTHDFKLFADSEEGVLPRKKIRIRSYPEQLNTSSNLEIKFSSVEGRYKESSKLLKKQEDNYFFSGYFDSLYGLVLPCCEIKYYRQYFIKDGIRITFDQNITYSSINGFTPFLTPESRCVIEIKAKASENKELINKLVPFPRSRFSKFSEAIKSLDLC